MPPVGALKASVARGPRLAVTLAKPETAARHATLNDDNDEIRQTLSKVGIVKCQQILAFITVRRDCGHGYCRSDGEGCGNVS